MLEKSGTDRVSFRQPALVWRDDETGKSRHLPAGKPALRRTAARRTVPCSPIAIDAAAAKWVAVAAAQTNSPNAVRAFNDAMRKEWRTTFR